ncbi:hypothetical protein CCAN11_2370011 [Capnocytophaga canimorsus]|uniref:Polysaccharide chain length determinant N-terminal domain-containing protein n=1 Tax=Capnocytophaga canimorsus TaxID=28188 RepID=A0A0B7IJ27_9FLAO|nr:hypothetical protein CCAN11_2370011 [Capnocytophaga canimorsus]
MCENKVSNTDEIDLLDLLRKLWRARKTILIVTFVFFVGAFNGYSIS